MTNGIRTFKKYPNRRIYDLEASQYVTIRDVRDMILSDERIRVFDSKSNEDITRSVLQQILFDTEVEGHQSPLTDRVLEELIRFYSDPNINAVRPYLEQQIISTLDQQADWRKAYKKFVSDIASPNAGALNPLEELMRPHAEAHERAMASLFKSFDGDN